MRVPKISVLMPAYNASKYIKEAIESVLNQSFTDFEFIIIDDCSTDDTWKIIKSYKDKRIKAFKNLSNLGVTNTLNFGLSKCRGDYIARMDSDDICLPKRFLLQVSELDLGYDIVGSNIIFIDQKGNKKGFRKYSNDIDSVIRLESPLAHPTVMFKKSFLDKVGNYDVKFDVSQDYDLWLRFYMKNAKFKIVESNLLKYRQHDESVKNLKTKKSLKTTLAIKKKAKKDGFNFKLKGNLRIFAEKVILLLPRKFIIFMFYLVKRK